MPTWVCKHELTSYGPTKYCNSFNRSEDGVCRKCKNKSFVSNPYRYEGEDGIVAKSTISEALELYGEQMMEVEMIFERLAEIERSLKTTLGVKFEITKSIATNRVYMSTEEASKYVHNETKRMIWSRLMTLCEIERFASSKKIEEFNKSLSEDNLPEPTPNEVSRWTKTMMDSLDGMVVEKAEAVFKFLRPRRSKLKTNKVSSGIAPKVILNDVIDWSFSNPRIHWTYKKDFADLESLFNTFDGRGYGTKGHVTEIQQAIESSSKKDGTGETDFFKVKVFKNGNLHLEIKRLDLLARLNKMCGSSALPEKGDQ